MSSNRTPYQGLVPYSEADAPFFFGREIETRLAVANLHASALTLFYGSSGVGKSSVLRAGVAHRLRQRADLLLVVFNRWHGNPARDLMQAVADCADRTDPSAWAEAAHLLGQNRQVSLPEFLTVCVTQLNRRLMIILDQFEEYFLYHPQDDQFANEFPGVVTQSHSPVSFLISTREDSLAKLDRFEERIPSLFDNRLRIAHLTQKAAWSAIEEPIKQYNRLNEQRFIIEPGLIEVVLEQVKTGQVILGEVGRGTVRTESLESQVETPFLQMVMTRLWDEEVGAGSRALRLQTLNALGGAERIVVTHLDQVMSALLPQQQEIAASIFHYLVTPSGTKIAYTAPDLAGSAELNEPEVVRVVERLSHGDVRILRTVDPSPDRPTAPRYEIFHDVLAPAVLHWRSQFVQERERVEAERRAAEKRRRSDEQARVETQQQRVSVLRRALTAMFLLLSLMTGLTIYAFRQRVIAKRALAEAYAQSTEAVKQRDLANQQSEIAAMRARELETANTLIRDEQTRTEQGRRRAVEQSQLAKANEAIAKRERSRVLHYADTLKALNLQETEAEGSYENTVFQIRTACGQKAALKTNLLEYTRLRAGYAALGESQQQARLSRRINKINTQLKTLACP